LEGQSITSNEIMVCEFNMEIKYIFLIVYRPPNAGNEFVNNLAQVLKNVKTAGYGNICVFGDFNMPNTKWDSLTSPNNVELKVCQVLDDYNLIQSNNCPSRQGSDNILDIILSTSTNSFQNIHTTISNVDTDHLQLNFELRLKHSIKLFPHNNINEVTFRQIYVFKEANYDELNYHLVLANLNDIVINHSSDLNLAWYKWKNKVIDILDKLIPKKLIKNNRSPPWIDGDVINLSNKKETARQKAKKTGKQSDWEHYKKISNNLKNLVNIKHKTFLNDSIQDLDVNPKKFWGIVSSKNKKGAIPDKVKLDNAEAILPKDKAELFNKFFFSQFNNNDYTCPDQPIFANLNLGHITVTEHEVLTIIKGLSTNKAMGADGLGPIFYKNCASAIVPSLTLLFNLSLLSGIIPTEWKTANIVPIHKKGSKDNIKNYRPISLLCTVGKILEKVVHNHVYSIIKEDIFINQHGFMSGKSTCTQLVEFYNKIHQNFDNNIQTDVIYLDLSKAFDHVPHKLLLFKLSKIGINNNLLNWFSNYLSHRKQRVVIEGHNSNLVSVLSGVPQGSILGPLLFTIYINDMATYLTDSPENLFLYADDSKLLSPINSLNDCLLLQQKLNNLLTWSDQWGMTFNPTKCFVMSFARKMKIIYNYCINNTVLLRTSSCTDLGLIISDNLRWDNHIKYIVGKAGQRLGLVKRCVGYDCSIQVKLTCYTSLIRPILEYGSVIWSCHTKKLLVQVESIQRRSLKYVLNDYSNDYYFRLRNCNLLPLSYRREYLDLVFIYNWLHELNNVNLDISFVNRNVRQTRHAPDMLSLANVQTTTCLFNCYYHNRIVNSWNSLPYVIRETELTSSGKNTTFKTKVKSWLFNHFFSNFDVDNTCSWRVACKCTLCTVT
jgi:hypothetical protein